MTKFISWNVNGLRAVMKKGFMDTFQALDADVFCLQETKLQAGQIDLDLPGYEQYWNYADRKGYSGTAIFTRLSPLSVRYGMGIDEHDHEGRLITLEFPDYYFVTCYTPNSQSELARQVLERLPEVFGHDASPNQHAMEAATGPLFQEIGRLKMELDWLKKKSASLKGG